MNQQIKTWGDDESYGSRVKVDGRSRSDINALGLLEKRPFAKTTDIRWECCENVRALRTLPNNY